MAPSRRDAPIVGVVGEPASGFSAAVADAGGQVVEGDVGDVLAADPDWIVAVDEASLLALVRAGVDRPVLPVAAGRGVASVPGADAVEAVEAVLGGDAEEVPRRLLSVSADGAATTSAFDVMLVTAEPAQISEFTVRTGGLRVARFRADGVVVATPAGSSGYAADVGGPIVEPGTGVVAVVPVAPFVTDADYWVLELGDVTLEVERDEPVTVVVDGREWRTIGHGETVTLTAGERLTLYRVPASRGFGDPA